MRQYGVALEGFISIFVLHQTFLFIEVVIASNNDYLFWLSVVLYLKFSIFLQYIRFFLGLAQFSYSEDAVSPLRALCASILFNFHRSCWAVLRWASLLLRGELLWKTKKPTTPKMLSSILSRTTILKTGGRKIGAGNQARGLPISAPWDGLIAVKRFVEKTILIAFKWLELKNAAGYVW
jgi:hypothetical protein